jgi:hypothetical protein
MPRNVRSEIVAFWRRFVIPRGLAGAVRVGGRTGETTIEIDDVMPRLPFLGREAGWRVSTKSGFLRADHFPVKTARQGIHFNDGKDRGRTLYCTHVPPRRERREPAYRGQIVVGLSWHIDEAADAPIIVTNLAIRGDREAHTDLSRAAAGWLMAYLLEVARQVGRPAEIGVEINTQPNAEDFIAIGFRAAATPSAYSPPYCAFRAPVRTR